MEPEVLVNYPPVSGTLNVYIQRARIRKPVIERLLEVTGGQLTRNSNIFGGREDSEERIREVIKEEYPEWRVAVNDERATLRREGDHVRWANIHEKWRQAHVGYVGTLPVFQVHHSTSRTDPEPYYLSTDLPGVSLGRNKYTRRDEAEMGAEIVLINFLGKIGAGFTD